MTSFDSFKHAVHTVFKETVEAVTPISNVSQFREKGVLTPEEFVAAGGQLSPSLSNAYQPCQPYPCAFIAVILRRSICGVLWGSPFPGGRWYGVVVLNERQGGSCNSQLQHAIDEPALIRRRLVVRKVPLVVVAGRRTGQGGCQLPPFDRPLFAEIQIKSSRCVWFGLRIYYFQSPENSVPTTSRQRNTFQRTSSI